MRPLIWFFVIAINLPLYLAGFPICYALAIRQAWTLRPSQYFGARTITAWGPRWAWLWGNEQDGVVGPQWWRDEHPKWAEWRLAFVWSAWRNPTNNLRFVPFLNPVIEPARIRYRGNSDDPPRNGIVDRKRVEWSYTWQGPYAGFALRWQVTSSHHASVRCGWKLLPKDRNGVAADDYRGIRCPFGVQLHVWRESHA